MTRQPPKHISIPSRHGADMITGRRLAGPVRWMTRGDPKPSPQRWRELGEALMQSDPVADRLAAWMLESGLSKTRALFKQALDDGIQTLPHAPKPLSEFFAQVDNQPEWVDADLLIRGAEASQITGMAGLHALRDVALMGGYQAAAINKTLVLTGSLTQGPQRRLAETTKWWIDCTATGGMARFGDGFKNTVNVRLMHSLVRRRVQRMSAWDSGAWGLPINQSDMAGTQLGFSVIFLLASRVLGVPLTSGEGHAVMHLWRYIGWLMGVDERWLATSEPEGRTLLYQILLSQAPPDDSSQQLGRALMDEPLQRFYPNLGWLRGRFDRARHLSISRLFLHAQGMRDLGLPERVLPWYPAITAPINLARHSAHRLLPGGRQHMASAGRDAQISYLQILFGDKRPAIKS